MVPQELHLWHIVMLYVHHLMQWFELTNGSYGTTSYYDGSGLDVVL